MYQQHYAGVIWTNHALTRMAERQLQQEMAYEAFSSPDRSAPGKQHSTTQFQKQFGKSLVTIVATQNENGEWIILSCWIDPPISGTVDSKKREEYIRYQKATPWKKFLIILRRQLHLLFTGRYY